jgi:dolichol-phosphate mannosyltransferase
MIYFLVPVYNEEQNLDLLAANLKLVLPGEEKIFVFSDDGSKDGSVEKIAVLFKDTAHIVLGDGSNHGPGYAFNTGFEWVLDHSAKESDILITIEADNTSDLSLLVPMVANNRMGFSLVLASVYAQGGGFDKTSFLRKLYSAVANLALRFIFDIKVQTLSSFYRAYSLGLLRKIKVRYPQMITETGFLCMIEILIKAIRVEATILEIPMMLNSAIRKGKSKMKVFKTMLSYVRFTVFKSSRF